jgi:transposase
MEKQNKLFIGIDVSKATIDIYFSEKHFKIKNDKKSIFEFIKSEITSKDIKPALVCLESTGGYENVAMEAFWEAFLPIHRAHPNRVHDFAKACGHFAKTDKLDAKLLEKYAAFVENEQKGDVIVSKATLELCELRSIERNLMEDLHATQCRMEHIKGKGAKYLEAHISFIKEEIEKVRKEMAEVIESDEKLKNKNALLKSYKGVGNQVSTVLLAELPELGKLNNKEIALLVGVAPKISHSGIKTPSGHISGGRFHVRKAMYMAALVAARYNKKMKAFYERLLQNGKAKKVALTAVMRKIVVCLNSMLKNNSAYIE